MQKHVCLQGFLNKAATTYNFILFLDISTRSVQNKEIYPVFCKEVAWSAQNLHRVCILQFARSPHTAVCIESA